MRHDNSERNMTCCSSCWAGYLRSQQFTLESHVVQDGLFMIAFSDPRGAVEWSVLLQLALLR